MHGVYDLDSLFYLRILYRSIGALKDIDPLKEEKRHDTEVFGRL